MKYNATLRSYRAKKRQARKNTVVFVISLIAAVLTILLMIRWDFRYEAQVLSCEEEDGRYAVEVVITDDSLNGHIYSRIDSESFKVNDQVYIWLDDLDGRVSKAENFIFSDICQQQDWWKIWR